MNPVTILLVEDGLGDAELICHALERGGLADGLHLVRDGVEALDFLSESRGAPPQLILLDLKLPKLDGLEVLRRIKSDPATRTIPVVMLTSSNVERDVVEAYRLGVNSYVQKPMEFEGLRETVVQVGRYWLSTNEPMPQRRPSPGSL